MMLVHQKIQKYITEHRIPQAYIAEQCGISEDIFNAMITGKRKMYADELRSICYALRVAPETFIGPNEHP